MGEVSHYVYKITDRDTGEYYYGKRSCSGSWRDDKYMGSGTLLLNKMNAHPEHDWHKEVLLLLDSEEEAYEYEGVVVGDKWVGGDSYDGKCLNLVPGGDGATSDLLAKRWEDPEFREKTSTAIKEAYNTPEKRAMASARAKRMWENPKIRQRLIAAIKKRGEDPRHKKLKRDYLVQRWKNKSYRAVMVAHAKRFWSSAAARAKASERTRQRWEDPEYKAKVRASMKVAASTEQAKAQLAARLELRWASLTARARQSEAVRRPINLVMGGEHLQVENGDEGSLRTYLTMGAEFAAKVVGLHNDELGVTLSVSSKAAKRVLLTEKGWCYGTRREYPKKGLKELGLSNYSRN